MTISLIGEFVHPHELITAARDCKAAGHDEIDAFTPMPLEELDSLVPGRGGIPLAAVMAAAGIVGLAAMFFLQYYGAAINYPLNVGGRPLDSWPAFVPSAWEICALATIYAGFFAFLAACHLPLLFHPVFAVPDFARVSQDHFFLCVALDDNQTERDLARRIFEKNGAVAVSELAE